MDFLSILQLPATTLVVYALPFLVALTVIVFIHELGHFLVARWCGVTVEAFSIGFGKEIAGWVDRKGTRWKICWIPLGGYVRFAGDANAASMPDAETAERPREPGNFHGKPVWQRAAVVVAGPLANFILAIAIFTVGYGFVGVPYYRPLVAETLPGGAAEKAGIRAGDLIVSINGQPTKSFQDVQEAVLFRGGEILTVVVDRNGNPLNFSVTPYEDEEKDRYGRVAKFARIGVKIDRNAEQLVERLPLHRAFAKGVERTGLNIAISLKYLGRIFTGDENGSKLGGAVSIAWVASQAASTGFFDFVLIIGLISVGIGLINLFPVPMLDGGHLVFYGIEAALGRPVGPNVQEWAFRVGFSLILLLMAFGLFNDIGWLTRQS